MALSIQTATSPTAAGPSFSRVELLKTELSKLSIHDLQVESPLGHATLPELPLAAESFSKEKALLITEIEPKFFFTHGDFKIAGEDVCRISQFYFPDEVAELIAMLAIEIANMQRELNPKDFTRPRIRMTEKSGSAEFALQIKGAKEGEKNARVICPELSIPIDRVLFERLLGHYRFGGLEKLRLPVTGYVVGAAGQLCPVKADVDQLLRVGPVEHGRPRDDLQGKIDFLLADIELPNIEWLNPVRNRKHSFSFLESAVELTACKGSLRKALSSRRLARCGFDDRAMEAVGLFKMLEGRPQI